MKKAHRRPRAFVTDSGMETFVPDDGENLLEHKNKKKTASNGQEDVVNLKEGGELVG